MFDLFKFKDLKQLNFENNTIQKQNNKKSQQLLIENIEVGFCRFVKSRKQTQYKQIHQLVNANPQSKPFFISIVYI